VTVKQPPRLRPGGDGRQDGAARGLSAQDFARLVDSVLPLPRAGREGRRAEVRRLEASR
jgi:hypothetical protein